MLAARRAGISHVLIPEENRRDLKDIPDNVKNYEIEIGAEIINSNEIYKSDQKITQDKPDPPNAMGVGKVKYLLDEERRIFKNESHYFDHPKIGVIISVYDSSL